MTVTVDRVEDALLERWVGHAAHVAAAVIQGPQVPTVAQIGEFVGHLKTRLTLFTGWTWVAAASVIGFEGLEILLGAMLTAPEFVPLIILSIAIFAVARNRLRAGRESGLRRNRWLR